MVSQTNEDPRSAGRIIRRAEEGDREAIINLFVAVNRRLAPPELAEKFEAYIKLCVEQEIRPFLSYYDRAVGNGFWVLIDSGELVGMFGLERVSPEEVELRRMYVDPDRRRSGYGRDLLRHAERSALAGSYRKLVLSTAELQKEAIALYKSEGFHLVRREEAQEESNKTIGGGIVRYHFEKNLAVDAD